MQMVDSFLHMKTVIADTMKRKITRECTNGIDKRAD